jgi:V/A-type H+-transporting ATPase subunit D
MKIKVNPNRMELLRLRKRLMLATRGHKLLKDKQEQMIRRFLVLMREARSLREKVEEALQGVYTAFLSARSSAPWEFLDGALSIPYREPEMDIGTLITMGVKTPEFTLRESEPQPPYGTFDTPGSLDLAVRQIDRLFPDLLALAERENAIALLARDLETTRQRVNALEHVLIPGLEEAIKTISAKLAENERATVTRLMKIKDMIRETAV